MTEQLISISYAAWQALSGADQHAIFHSASKLVGELRLEVVSDEWRMLPLVAFRGRCEDLVPIPEVHEAIGLAEDIIIGASHRGSTNGGSYRLDFYFSDKDAAILFKLTWGGAA